MPDTINPPRRLLLVVGAVVMTAAAPPPQPAMVPIPLDDDLIMVLANAEPGQGAAFEQWLDRHMRSFLTIPGLRAGQRFTVEQEGRQAGDKDIADAMILYDVTSAATPQLASEIAARGGAANLPSGETVDRRKTSRTLFRPLGPALAAAKVPGTSPAPAGAGPLGDHYLVVLSDPATPEQEDAFNSWYDLQHRQDVLRVPGFVEAQRFVRIGGGGADTPRWLIVFRFASRDIAATNAEIFRRIREKITVMSPAFGKAKGFIATAAGPAIRGSR